MKLAKRIALIFLFLVFIVVTSGVIIAYMYQDKVKRFLVAEITKQLEAETGVADIEFSVLRKFPKASLSFNQIWCKSVGGNMTYDTLFYADRLFLQFHIMDIFSNKYSITRIDLENARVNIEINSSGVDNYHFWKEPASSDSIMPGEALSVDLEKMVFENTHFNYLHHKKQHNYSILANHLEAGGSLMENSGSLTLAYDIQVSNLDIGGTNYLNNKSLIGSIDFAVDSTVYEIKSGDVSVDGLKVKVDGYLEEGLQGSSSYFGELSLRFRGTALDIEKVLALLPDTALLGGDSIGGAADLNIAVKADIGSTKFPSVRVDFKTKDASLKVDSFNLDFTHINMDGMYASNHVHTIDGVKRKDEHFVEVFDFSSQIGFDRFGGNFKLWDFGNTMMDLELKGEFDLENLKDSNVPGLDSLLVIEGIVQFEVSTTGLLKAYTDHRRNYFKNVSIQGLIDMDDLVMQRDRNSLPMEVAEGRLVLSDNDVLVNNLTVDMESSNLVLDGHFQNVIPFFLMENQDLLIDAQLTSDLIDLNELLRDYSSSSSKSDTAYQLEFPERINFNLTTDIDRLIFRRFDARDIEGGLKLKNQKLIASNLKFGSMNGLVELNGLIDASGTRLLVSCDVDIRDINITKMFHAFENFGQKYITESNIQGIGTADLQFVSVWEKDLKVIEDKIYAKADITIVKGALINNESLLALSDYISVSELEHVRFSALRNQIEIKNRNIHIPRMEIASSALDITVSGDHTFDHDINYKFKIYLPELLSKKSKKAKKENEEFGVIEDDGLGLWLFLSMTGTVQDPIIKYDKKSYVQKIGEDLKKEKQTLKAILNEEFGWFKKDTTITKKNKKTDKKNKKETFGDDYFIIEWDEDADDALLEDDDDF